MFCPSCQLVVRGDVSEAAAPCPVCGGTLRDVSESDMVELVEAIASLGGVDQPAVDEEVVSDGASRAVVRVRERPLPVALSRLSMLPALAWRQPVVRAAVRTGASALALSLAVRAARAMMVGRRASGDMADTMLPTVADLLQSPPAARRVSDPTPQVEIVETFVYLRRVVRR